MTLIDPIVSKDPTLATTTCRNSEAVEVIGSVTGVSLEEDQVVVHDSDEEQVDIKNTIQEMKDAMKY